MIFLLHIFLLAVACRLVALNFQKLLRSRSYRERRPETMKPLGTHRF
jgi:hypothetical protein